MEIKDKLIKRIDSQYFPPRGATLVVAVSGGVDSMVLLNTLLLLSAKWDWQLIVAHFNHGLRKSAIQDAKFVEAAARMLGLKFVCGTADVAKLAKSRKLTAEEAGRVARYAWLQRVAKRYRAAAIVTAHTADDQAETVVMNWLRGGLVRALAGMRIRESDIWRPFLDVKKTDLYQFAKKYRIQFREDESNRDLIYRRNLVRHQVLPMLGKINPRIREVLVRNASSFAELEDWLGQHLNDVYKKVSVSNRAGTMSFNEKRFRGLVGFWQRELLLLAVQKLTGSRQDIKRVHLDEAINTLASGKKTSWQQLPGKLFLSRGYGKINVSRHRPKLVNK